VGDYVVFPVGLEVVEMLEAGGIGVTEVQRLE
jgi:hypothetical protein